MKFFLSFLIFIFSLSISAQTTYTVSGNAYLSDILPTTTGHDSITIYFIDLIQQDTVATSLTDTYGSYSVSIPAGFYLVKWLKYGYIPQELGNYTLSSSATLSDVTLLPGFIQNVCGNVSGTWASGNVYHVDCDITIPSGDSLTIEPGVLVRFATGTKLTANGKLKVLGSSSDRVSFTSLSPSPLPGDWNNVVLNSTNNTINHLDYDYATNGFTGTSASGTSIDSLRMVGTLSLTANGIYLDNTTNLSIDNSIISVAGSYGVYAQNANNSSITNSTIDGTYSEAAIKMESCIGCVVNNNIISNSPNYGVWMDYGFNITISENTIDADYYGIRTDDGSYYTLNNNTIRLHNLQQNSDERAITFSSSENCTINNNHITSSYYTNYAHMIYNGHSNTQAIINNNHIELGISSYDSLQCYWYNSSGNQYSPYGLYAIYVEDPLEINSNTILQNQYYDGNAIRVYQNSGYNIPLTIENNHIEIFSKYDWTDYSGAIYLYDYSGNNSSTTLIKNNTLEVYNGSNVGIYARRNNTDIIDNTISFGDRYSWQCGLSQYGYYLRAVDIDDSDHHIIKGNTITNFARGIEMSNSTNNIVDSNYIYTVSDYPMQSYSTQNFSDNYGIYANNSDSLFITNNSIKTGSGALIYQTNGASTIKYNLLETESGRGIWCENQAGVEFSNNTLVSTNGTGDYGMYISNLSAPIIKNNIIDNFQNGIYVDNTVINYAIQYNDIWDVSGSEYSGSALPPLIGSYIALNNNGDNSDIYGNISYDPLFDANDLVKQEIKIALNLTKYLNINLPFFYISNIYNLNHIILNNYFYNIKIY